MTCSGEPRLMPELQPPARDQVGRSGVLGHVQRVLVAHVDDRRADLDPLRPGADRREQRERRRQLLGEVVDAEVRTVRAEPLDRLGELDRLDERVRRRPHLRVGRGGPVPERQEPDLLHRSSLGLAAPCPALAAGRSRRPQDVCHVACSPRSVHHLRDVDRRRGSGYRCANRPRGSPHHRRRPGARGGGHAGSDPVRVHDQPVGVPAVQRRAVGGPARAARLRRRGRDLGDGPCVLPGDGAPRLPVRPRRGNPAADRERPCSCTSALPRQRSSPRSPRPSA